jgi:hypothetical protein
VVGSAEAGGEGGADGLGAVVDEENLGRRPAGGGDEGVPEFGIVFLVAEFAGIVSAIEVRGEVEGIEVGSGIVPATGGEGDLQSGATNGLEDRDGVVVGAHGGDVVDAIVDAAGEGVVGIVDAENGQGPADDVQIGGGLVGVALAVLKIVVPGFVVGGADPGAGEGMAGGPEKIDMSADGVEGQPDKGVVQIE